MEKKETYLEHVIVLIFLSIFAFYCGYSIGGRQSRTIVIDTETRSIVERQPMKQYDGHWFPIGSKLTSKENGELIIAPEGTPDELIVKIIE